MRLHVGELGQRRRIEPFHPSRLDQFDRHAHGVDQCTCGVEVETVGGGRIHVAADAQRDLRLDAAHDERQGRTVGRARMDAARRQQGVRLDGLARRTAGFPVRRTAVAEAAQRRGNTVPAPRRRLRHRQAARRRRSRAGRSRALSTAHERRRRRSSSSRRAFALQSAGQRSAHGARGFIGGAEVEQRVVAAVAADQLHADRQALARGRAGQGQRRQARRVDPAGVDGVAARADFAGRRCASDRPRPRARAARRPMA